jgi:hypothetical protein
MPHAHSQRRLELVQQYSIFRHGIMYLATMHQSIMRGAMTAFDRRQMLFYKFETIRMLQSEIVNPAKDRLEMLLAVIICLLRDDIGEEQLQAKGQAYLRFVPHMPNGCWLNVNGRTSPVPAHARALLTLAKSAGGMHSLSFDTTRSLRV